MTATTLPEALVAALAELQNPRKDKTANTGAYSYKYADLATILDGVRPVLGRHGLAITQDVQVSDGQMLILTVLHHTSGQSLTFGPIQAAAGRDWQGLGSAVTYARRYALTAALGLAGDEDDDAIATKPRAITRHQGPTGPDEWTTPEPAPQTLEVDLEAANARFTHTARGGRTMHNGTEKATEKQLAALAKMVGRVGYDNLEQLLAADSEPMLGRLATTADLTKAEASAIFDAIKAYEKDRLT